MGERIRAASDDVNSQHNRLLSIHIRLQYAPNIYPESRHYGNSVWRSQADCSRSRVASHQKGDVISHPETNLKKQQWKKNGKEPQPNKTKPKQTPTNQNKPTKNQHNPCTPRKKKP